MLTLVKEQAHIQFIDSTKTTVAKVEFRVKTDLLYFDIPNITVQVGVTCKDSDTFDYDKGRKLAIIKARKKAYKQLIPLLRKSKRMLDHLYNQELDKVKSIVNAKIKYLKKQ